MILTFFIYINWAEAVAYCRPYSCHHIRNMSQSFWVFESGKKDKGGVNPFWGLWPGINEYTQRYDVIQPQAILFQFLYKRQCSTISPSLG